MNTAAQLKMVFGGFYLVKTHHVHLTAHVDPLRADAEDADPLQAALGEHDPGRHGGWQGRRHSDGDDVQRLDDDGIGRNLEG